MFKKKCPRCESKISRSSNFCPFCGLNLNSKTSSRNRYDPIDPRFDNDDYGLLGRNDGDESFESMFNHIPMNKILQSAMKMVEKQMREMQKAEQTNQKNPPKQSYSNLDIQFFVNGKRVSPKQPINLPQKTGQPHDHIKKQLKAFPEEKASKIAKLPKKEPKSKVRRLAGKVIYEVAVPGVKDINDILINQLEDSIEIKALSKNKVYAKTLNVNLPITGYKLDEGNLILELQAK